MQHVRSSTARTLAWLPALRKGIDIAGRGRLLVGRETQRQGIREITPGLGDRWLVRGLAIERQPRYSPDGKALAFTSNRAGGLDIWDISLETGALRRLTDHSGDDWDPAYSRDGRSLVFNSNRTGHFEIWMSSADGSNPKQVSADGVDAQNPSVSADGNWIVYSGFRGERPGLWKVHPDGTGATAIVPDTKNRLPVPEISPDGSLVAIAVPGNGGMLIHIVRLADGSPFPFEQPTRVGPPRPHWMPDGRSLVFKDRHPGGPITLWTRPLEGQAPARRLPGFEGIGNIETFDVSPDGKRFAVSVLELSRSVLLVENVPGVAGRRGQVLIFYSSRRPTPSGS
ncbi:MAG: PD40 domain-containing protein [Deltaproteobacteria bacterium]|nr:PD40 domain-containing protein [Deltaproteobacteria bacterium]